jgi:hypothetical protein
VKRAVKGVDGSRDNHGGKARMQLLGAADQFIAVHLWHNEIAENKIEGAGNRSLKNLQRLLSGIYRDDAVTSGFEKKGADGEGLFVVIYAKDRFLGAHAVSLLLDVTLWWLTADGPVWRVCWFAGRTGLGVTKDCPVARPYRALQARDGASAPIGSKQKERSPPVRSTGDQFHPSGELGCRTAGCERARLRVQVATRPFEARDHSAASTVRVDAEELASALVRVQTARLRSGSRDCRAVKLLSTQIVRKTGESNFISNDATHGNVAVNAFQQYEWLARLATAKLERRWPILELAHPPQCDNGANSLGIHEACLLKLSASRQEKTSACNRNCAAADEHF